jgi:cytochrome c biogenesis factor
VAIALGGLLLSSMFTSTVERSLAPGEMIRLNAWTVQLHDVWPAAGEGWAGLSAELRASSGDGVIVLEPKHQFLSANEVRSGPARLKSDGGVLTARLGPRDSAGRWPIRLSWTPMLVLVPIGLAISLLGLVTAMVGPSLIRRRRLRQARLATAWWA